MESRNSQSIAAFCTFPSANRIPSLRSHAVIRPTEGIVSEVFVGIIKDKDMAS